MSNLCLPPKGTPENTITKESDKLAEFYRSNDPELVDIERRKRWTGLPGTRNPGRERLVIVPGYRIEGTYWWALGEPYRIRMGKYNKTVVEARCKCGTVKTVRLDNLSRGATRWCRRCASRNK
jgi:hypothetical protein